MPLAKKIKFHAQVQKCHFGKIENLPKWHFWKGAWNLKFFWPKAFFWSILKMTISKNIHNMSQGPPNPGFMQINVRKGDFLKNWIGSEYFFGCLKTCTSSVACCSLLSNLVPSSNSSIEVVLGILKSKPWCWLLIKKMMKYVEHYTGCIRVNWQK